DARCSTLRPLFLEHKCFLQLLAVNYHDSASLKKLPVLNVYEHNREETLPDNLHRSSSSRTHSWTSGRTLHDQESRCSRDTQGIQTPTLTTHNYCMGTPRRQHTNTHHTSKVLIAKERSHTPVNPRTYTLVQRPSYPHKLISLVS
ncbi:hypothetical protein A4X13_0g9520, partial [Tilletia indica]